MKPGKDFRLRKTTKRMLALMKVSEEKRNLWKSLMISGELAEKLAKNSKINVKSNQGDE